MEPKSLSAALPTPEFHCHVLPPAVKRKYFSTLERLRLVHGCPQCNPDLPRSKPEPLSLSGRRSLTWTPSNLPRKNDKNFRLTSNAATGFLTHTDAQWFSTLPEKIRQTQFSQEERKLLAGERDSLPVDSTDQNFYRLRQQAASSVPTLAPSTLSSVSSPSRRSSGSSFEYFDTLETFDPADDMDESMFRWMDEEPELDLRLDDYHSHLSTHGAAPSNSQSQNHLPSFRRNLSLPALPSAGTSLPSPKAGALTPTHSSASRRFSANSLQQPLHHRATSRVPTIASSDSSFLPIHYPTHCSIRAIDPQASHYTDPVARHKLRNYLASPSKFDEAIEFGFPSLQDQATNTKPKRSVLPPRPSLSSLHRNRTAPAGAICPQTFLNSSSLSLLSTPSNNGSTASLPETTGPHTPSEAVFRNAHRLLLFKATGKANVVETSSSTAATSGAPEKISSSYKKTSEPYAELLAGNREMTLKMTLTRPDLRSEKEVTFYGIGGEDPLALGKLPPVSGGDGVTDFWNTMGKEPRQKGVIRKAWRKISGRT